NPAQSHVTIELKETKALLSGKIDIFNVFGIKLFSGCFPTRKYSIDVTNFPAGLYILRINLDGMEHHYRLLIQR
ncbi:MAG: T9SS type A sorting domain-containing protein, partial [Bacteroidota bacterium]